MKQQLFATISALAYAVAARPSPKVDTAAAACDRATLIAVSDSYVAAQAAGQLDTLKGVDGSTVYTQNFKTATLASGLLSQSFKIDHNRSTHDTTQCATYTELIIADTKNPHVVATQIRLSPNSTAAAPVISKIETIVTSTGDWLFNAPATLRYASQESWVDIPEGKRDTREAIQAAGDAYLDLFSDKSVKVPWGNPCARLEGGSYIQPSCNVGVPSGIKQTNRRYVVDEVTGSVDIFFTFANAEPDSHEFRVEGGKLRYVHTLTVMH
ncbi:hypothetical protein PG995_008089 [Apiospora arundinis]|uniref:DUF8021 domain-containing protein n=1 Tax=Apiospora arundinis TaxID=335852 RepID=A0ABR2HZK3_9PEZI